MCLWFSSNYKIIQIKVPMKMSEVSSPPNGDQELIHCKLPKFWEKRGPVRSKIKSLFRKRVEQRNATISNGLHK